jgi:hypothetical protein
LNKADSLEGSARFGGTAGVGAIGILIEFFE